MAFGSGNSSQLRGELLQINANTSLSYTEKLCKIADLKTYCKASKEEIIKLKHELQIKQTEYKYKVEHRDTLRKFYEELKRSHKRVDELIQVKKDNVELTQELYDLKKQKALEKDKQDKIMLKQLTDLYKESMKIFESNPLVIKRNELRKRVARRKFDIAFLKQKMSDAEAVYAKLQKYKKLIEQREIIKFANAMVKYYAKQKERKEILMNKQNLKNINTMQEQKSNLQVISEKHQENVIAAPLEKLEFSSFIKPTNYDHIYNKTSSQFKTTLRTIERPKVNIKQVQIPTLNLSNYQFNPKNYLNRNLPVILKQSDQQADTEPPKEIISNLFNTLKQNLKSSTLPKFEENSNKSKKENNSTYQTKPKQQLKRPAYIQESVIKPKVLALTKNKEDINLALNTSTEKEERLFLSQPESKNSSLIDDTFVSLSQNSKKSVTSNSSQQYNLQAITPKNKTTSKMDNTSINQSSQSVKQNQMFNFNSNIENTAENTSLNLPQNRQSVVQRFNLQSVIPKIHEKKESQKQNQIKYSQQTMGQMFNLQATVPKRTEISESKQQNPTEYYRQIPPMNQMFNLQATVSKNTVTNETQKQTPLLNQMFNLQTITPQQTEIHKTTPVENNSKIVNFSNPVSRPLETKSPYFVNQTITSSQEESVGINTSAEQSDHVMNISSDRPPSQISVVDISGEYSGIHTNQPMDNEQMINTEGAPMMDFDNAGYNMVQYFGENPDMLSLRDMQHLSPTFNSPSNYLSPNESISGENQENNIAPSSNNNIFGAVQSTGNGFLTFGQSESKTGSIFNMF